MASSKYMQALLGVLASGRRRKPVYIRQQALVSKLYPYFFEDTPVTAGLGIYETSIIALAVEQGIVDGASIQFGLFGLEVRQLTSTNIINDTPILTNLGFHELTVKDIQIKYSDGFDDVVSTSFNLHALDVTRLAIPVDQIDEPVQCLMNFYEVNIYAP